MNDHTIGLDLIWQIAAGEAARAQYELIEPEHCGTQQRIWNETNGKIITPRCVYLGKVNDWCIRLRRTIRRNIRCRYREQELCPSVNEAVL